MSFLASFRFASEGLLYVFVTQRNFRVHLAIAAIVVALGLWLQLAPASWAILALTIGAVLVTEIFNTAAERLVDLVSPDYHPLAKQVKDLAAGAVLVSAIVSVIVGLLVLGPPLWAALRALRF
ncbi:MAG: diacylglycerol kinase family protein [Anaerolineae bacterium]|nr:diacylglycerol kinase family protein [Anaerolineae bacterium]